MRAFSSYRKLRILYDKNAPRGCAKHILIYFKENKGESLYFGIIRSCISGDTFCTDTVCLVADFCKKEDELFCVDRVEEDPS